MIWNWWKSRASPRMPELRLDGPLAVEPDGENTSRCDCCSDQTRTLIGWISAPTHTVAAYYVRWIPGKLAEHGASVHLVVGRWGEGAEPQHRAMIWVDVRWPRGPAEFMVVDAEPAEAPELAAHALTRAEVIGSPLKPGIFKLTDAIWGLDPRLDELRGFRASRPPRPGQSLDPRPTLPR